MIASKLGHLVSDNDISHVRRQVVIWTDDGVSFIVPLKTNISVILIEIKIFLLHKFIWKYRLQNGCDFVSTPMCWWRLVKHATVHLQNTVGNIVYIKLNDAIQDAHGV